MRSDNKPVALQFVNWKADKERLAEDCYEAFNIQVHGLMRRFRTTSGSNLIIGVSGGLNSTHALIVAAKASDRLGLPRNIIKAFTLPGFATGKRQKPTLGRSCAPLALLPPKLTFVPPQNRC